MRNVYKGTIYFFLELQMYFKHTEVEPTNTNYDVCPALALNYHINLFFSSKETKL
jgi:hypothetical protein